MQEVIVYRTPMEAAMWNALTEHPEIFLFFVIAAIVFVGTARIVESLPFVRNKGYRIRNQTALWSGVFAGMTTLFACFRYF